MSRAWLRRLCWPCAAIGIGLLGVSYGSYAADLYQPESGPYWRDVAVGAVGIVLLLIGVYARSIEGRVEDLEDGRGAVDNLEKDLLRKYHDKDGVEAAIRASCAPLEVKIDQTLRTLDALHRRFDEHGIGRDA